MLAFTDWAIEIRWGAAAAAGGSTPAARVRVVGVPRGGGDRFELTDERDPGDLVIEHPDGFTLFAEAGLEGTVDVVEPHDRLILRAPDDPERSVRQH